MGESIERVADAEELRQLLTLTQQQFHAAQQEAADTRLLMAGLERLLTTNAQSEPIMETYEQLQRLFDFSEAVLLLEDPDPSVVMLNCLAATNTQLKGSTWSPTPMIQRALRGRVIATVPTGGRTIGWPDLGQQPGIDLRRPALLIPIAARGQRGVIILLRERTADGFDRRDVAVGRKFTLLASHALATIVAHRTEAEREDLHRFAEELRRARDALSFRADHDELTGLANRSYLERAAAAAIVAATDELRIGVIFVDLDGFKQVNDYYGHEVGDELLRAVSQRLMSYTLDETDLVARISGDEFIVLANPIVDYERMMGIVRDGLMGMREPFTVGGRQLMVSASVGVAIYPQHGRTFDELRRNADIAMYRAKRTARGSVVEFEPSMALEVVDRLDREQALRGAVRQRRFCAVVQPKVRLGTMQPSGFEILARMVTGEGELGAAADFIDVATQTGLLDEITDIVLDDALTAIPALDAVYGPDTRISLNVSTRQATDPTLLGALIDRLTDSGYADRFTLEVTEDALLEYETFSDDIAPLLGGSGVWVSIDDFGTGFAALSRLLQISADEIKIDRSFIMSIDHRPRSQVFVEALGTIGRELGAVVTAEGVETESELQYLARSGVVDEMQGFLFGRPELPGVWVEQYDMLRARLEVLRAHTGV